jgi:hypothetical protein
VSRRGPRGDPSRPRTATSCRVRRSAEMASHPGGGARAARGASAAARDRRRDPDFADASALIAVGRRRAGPVRRPARPPPAASRSPTVPFERLRRSKGPSAGRSTNVVAHRRGDRTATGCRRLGGSRPTGRSLRVNGPASQGVRSLGAECGATSAHPRGGPADPRDPDRTHDAAIFPCLAKERGRAT